jgi:undecaprenyl-diphosphatase
MEFLNRIGLVGLFVHSVCEAVFLPIPVEGSLVLNILNSPFNAIRATIVAVTGSVLGAVISHQIGFLGGEKFLDRFFNSKKKERAEVIFEKYGFWSVGIAALTPLPYKFFALISGVLRMSRVKLIFVATIARSIRFIIVALTTLYFS